MRCSLKSGLIESTEVTTKKPNGKYNVIKSIDSHRYKLNRHVNVIAECLPVHKIFITAVVNEEFRAIQKYYCTEASVVDNNRMKLTRKNVSEIFLPFRANGAKSTLSTEISSSQLMSRDYTNLDDGWTSFAKWNMSGIMIGRPGTKSQTIAILPVNPDHLNGI